MKGNENSKDGVRDGLGNLDNMEQFLSDKLPWFMLLPGS
jgi:hypothetical protein